MENFFSFKKDYFGVLSFESFRIFQNNYKLFLLISNTFISKTRLKLAKNQANATQHPAVEPLLFENYSHSSSKLSSKNNRAYSEK